MAKPWFCSYLSLPIYAIQFYQRNSQSSEQISFSPCMAGILQWTERVPGFRLWTDYVAVGDLLGTDRYAILRKTEHGSRRMSASDSAFLALSRQVDVVQT